MRKQRDEKPEEEQVRPEDEEFLEWCQEEHQKMIQQSKDAVKQRKQQHTRDYFNKYSNQL